MTGYIDIDVEMKSAMMKHLKGWTCPNCKEYFFLPRNLKELRAIQTHQGGLCFLPEAQILNRKPEAKE